MQNDTQQNEQEIAVLEAHFPALGTQNSIKVYGYRERIAAGTALKQRHTQFCLQGIDAARQRRLRDVQRRRRLDETAVLVQGEQVVQLAQLDRHVGVV